MKRLNTMALLALPFAMSLTSPANFPTIGSVVRLDPQMDQLVPKDARIEVLASGFVWSEGPVWINRDGGYLLFSDVPQNTIFKWTEKDGLSPFLKPSGYTGLMPYGNEPGSNGLTLDRQGGLVLCEHGDRRVSVMPLSGGGKRTIVDHYNGKRFNSPNDVVVHSGGAVYFTDPPYGLPQNDKDPSRELDVFGVYRAAPDGSGGWKATLLISDLTRPNGLAFSPDEKTLYVAQSDPARPVIMAYAVQPDGTVTKGRVLYDASEGLKQGLKGLPDGLRVDQKGNLWATGPGGVLVISPQGKLLGRIDPGEATANCAWGNDGSTLYLTADMYVCRIRTNVKGVGF